MKISKEQFAYLENFDLKIRDMQKQIKEMQLEQQKYLSELIAPKELGDVSQVINNEIIFKEEKVESTD